MSTPGRRILLGLATVVILYFLWGFTDTYRPMVFRKGQGPVESGNVRVTYGILCYGEANYDESEWLWGHQPEYRWQFDWVGLGFTINATLAILALTAWSFRPRRA